MVRSSLAHLKVEQPVIAVALKVAQNELLAAGHEDDAIVAGIRHGLAALRAGEVAEPWPEARWTRLKRFTADTGLVLVAAAGLYGIARAAGLPAFGWLP